MAAVLISQSISFRAREENGFIGDKIMSFGQSRIEMRTHRTELTQSEHCAGVLRVRRLGRSVVRSVVRSEECVTHERPVKGLSTKS